MRKEIRIERWREGYAPNAAMLRLTLEREGYRVYQWGDQPGMIYAQHKHAAEQSHWIVSGAMEFTVQGCGTYTLNAGDRDFMPAETYHTARVVSEDAVVYLIGEKLE